jgi:hypothetical protein
MPGGGSEGINIDSEGQTETPSEIWARGILEQRYSEPVIFQRTVRLARAELEKLRISTEKMSEREILVAYHQEYVAKKQNPE